MYLGCVVMSETTPLEEEVKKYVEMLKDKPKDELVREYALLLWRLDKLGPVVKYLLSGIGQWFRGIRRDYVPIDGVLLSVELEPKEFEVWVDYRSRQYGTNKIVHEMKVVRLPAKSLIYYEVIPFREEIEEKEESH